MKKRRRWIAVRQPGDMHASCFSLQYAPPGLTGADAALGWAATAEQQQLQGQSDQ
jgi:hypothetical protein